MTLIQRIRGFFKTLGRSCYDMELYRGVRAAPWTRAFAYAAAFFALVSVALTLSAASGSYGLLADLESGIRGQVPDGAEFQVKDGKFSTTLQPGTEFGEEGFVLAVDDAAYGKDFPRAFEDRVGMFIGRDAVFIQEEDGSREIIPLEGAPDFGASKDGVLAWIGDNGGWLVTGLLFLFLGTYFSFSLTVALIYAAAAALAMSAIGRLWKVRLGYAQWFAVGLHAVTLPTLIDYLFGFFGLDVPFAFSVVFFMFMFAVIADEKARPVKKAGQRDSSTARQLDSSSEGQQDSSTVGKREERP